MGAGRWPADSHLYAGSIPTQSPWLTIRRDRRGVRVEGLPVCLTADMDLRQSWQTPRDRPGPAGPAYRVSGLAAERPEGADPDESLVRDPASLPDADTR